MKQAVFTLPNAGPDPVVVNERYLFTDGKHVRNEDDGKLLEPVLCAYYGCTLEWVDDTPVVEATGEVAVPTLAKAQTSKAK
jgi:hypothetical protein